MCLVTHRFALITASALTLCSVPWAVQAAIPLGSEPTIPPDKSDRVGVLGLTWGDTTGEVRAKGVLLDQLYRNSNYGSSYSATGASKRLLEATSIELSFGNDDKLWRVKADSRPITTTPDGAQLVERYQQIAGMISERYGPGVETDMRDTELWTKPSLANT